MHVKYQGNAVISVMMYEHMISAVYEHMISAVINDYQRLINAARTLAI